MKKLTLAEAEKLAMETDYAIEASEQEINPINIGDAGAFFLEGYNYALTQIDDEYIKKEFQTRFYNEQK